MLVLGIDLAWGEGTATAPANETGVVAATPDGRIINAGWTVGLDATIEWIDTLTGSDDDSRRSDGHTTMAAVARPQLADT